MDILEQLVENFLTELRSGADPDIEEFCCRHTDFAEELREILPTVLLFERSLPSTSPKGKNHQRNVPDQIGEYEIVREIGAGGMGIVYEARHRQLGRRVALKVLTASLSTVRTHRERFRREIRLASNLHHTNIVPVFETGIHAGTPYFTMQYIDGQSLEHWPTQTRSISDVDRFRLSADVVRQVADALQYANEQGILHRDIKPSNLLRDGRGLVWITDFGLARQQTDGVTRTGDIVGTLRYIAPERFSSQADQRSDIYSLGLTLYELCTLRPAFFEQDQVRLYRDILESQPQRPRSLFPSIPRDLETIILRSIEKDPKLRYQTAGELADDLRLWLDDRPIRSRPVSTGEQLWRWGRRNPLSASLATALALMLLFIVGALAYSSHRRGQIIGQLNQANQVAQARLYDSYLRQAQANRWSGRPGQNYHAMEAIDQASKLVIALFPQTAEREAQRLKLRNEAISAMVLADISPRKVWELPDNERIAMAFDPTLTRYARADSNQDLILRQVADESEMGRIPTHDAFCLDLRFSLDGRFIAGVFHHQESASPAFLRVWDSVECRESLRVEGLPRPTIWDWHEPSQSLAISDRKHQLLLFDYGTGVQRQAQAADARPLAMCFLDANRLAISRDEASEVEVLELPAFLPIHRLTVDEEITSLAWSPSKQILAAGSAVHGEIYLWTLATDSLMEATRLKGHRGRVNRLFFNHQGQVLASNSWDSTVRLWDVVIGRDLMKIEAVSVVNPGFGHNDQGLALTKPGNRFNLANVTFNGPLRKLPQCTPDSQEWANRFHPTDNRVLAVATSAGLYFWDCQQRKILAKADTGLVRTVDFSSDGQYLFVGGESGVMRCLIEWQKHSDGPSLEILKTEILNPNPVYRTSLSGDGSRLVAFGEREPIAKVIDVAAGTTICQTGEHHNLDRAIISPDGRWVVTSTWGGTGVRIWNADSGQLVRELNSQRGSASIGFSPSGTWLAATDGQRQHLWRVDDWELVHLWDREEPDGWPGPVTFAPDETFLVLPQNRTTARLVDVQSGLCLAVLESPNQSSVSSYAVSHCGRYVALVHADGINHWDLNHIRQRLAMLGLDW